MDMTGEQRIPATRDIVWKALNDPDILQACIPGCQELIKSSETEMTAVAVIKVGPVSARFQGAVTLSDLDPPNGYRITGEGQGGVAGFAKGTAVVRLEADGEETILRYEVTAQIGGKLSQLGGRLIDATAKQMSLAFFKRFAKEIEAIEDGALTADPAASRNPPVPDAAPATTLATPRSPRNRIAPQPTEAGFSTGVTPRLVALVIAAVATTWLISSGAAFRPGYSPTMASPDVAWIVQLLVIAVLGYLFGREQNRHELRRETKLHD